LPFPFARRGRGEKQRKISQIQKQRQRPTKRGNNKNAKSTQNKTEGGPEGHMGTKKRKHVAEEINTIFSLIQSKNQCVRFKTTTKNSNKTKQKSECHKQKSNEIKRTAGSPQKPMVGKNVNGNPFTTQKNGTLRGTRDNKPTEKRTRII